MNTIKQTSENTLRTRAEARNKRLGQAGISIGGSLTRILRKCGKKQCRCAENPGFRHELLAEIDSLALKILKAHAAKNRAEIKKKTLLK